jgi:hypothetical protein
MPSITADILRSKFGFNDPNVINNILNDPGQVQRYNREAGFDTAYNAQQAANKAKAEQQALAEKQTAREEDFLTRFRTAIPEARTAIESELGLPALRENALTAGTTARNVQDQFGAITPTQQTVAKQVGISAPRLQQRISSKTAELAPALSAASSGLSGANAALESGLTTYGTRMGETMKPYETEATVLSESLARELSGFTTVVQGELDAALEKLKQQGTLDLQEMQNLQALAEKEKDYLNQRSTIDLGNRTALINPYTGQEISSYKQGVKPTIGTLYDGW